MGLVLVLSGVAVLVLAGQHRGTASQGRGSVRRDPCEVFRAVMIAIDLGEEDEARGKISEFDAAVATGDTDIRAARYYAKARFNLWFGNCRVASAYYDSTYRALARLGSDSRFIACLDSMNIESVPVSRLSRARSEERAPCLEAFKKLARIYARIGERNRPLRFNDALFVLKQVLDVEPGDAEARELYGEIQRWACSPPDISR